MFVDDTDLFFSGTCGVPDEEFLAMVKEEINGQVSTVVCTVGNIKIDKSYAKVSTPVWNQGYCKAKKSGRLTIGSFTIPQRDKSFKSIKVLDYKVAKSL